ncbi:unnamed protein product [Phytophthora fragariaefolia]|uniref:Unnamed protein product n=1 Tax=Phytophthora fragariaefolia TaxID=1490495 RepID=A0A9W7D5B5_9STRA|nr:unnamed protein product [Phytophthora fragariaefolia]
MYPLVRVALMWSLSECVAPLHSGCDTWGTPPRGRRPAVIGQLRAVPPPPQNKLSNYVACLPVVGFSICDLLTEASESSACHIESTATAGATGSPGDIELSSRTESISVRVADDEVVQASSPIIKYWRGGNSYSRSAIVTIKCCCGRGSNICRRTQEAYDAGPA